jgi:acid phosphatase type 7
MFAPSRREFLGASVAALAAGPALLSAAPVYRSTDATPFHPDTLFLTWHRDPTTTMVVQWVGTRGETSDTTIVYRPVTTPLPAALSAVSAPALSVASPPVSAVKPVERPYPRSDFKVFRAELTDLKPGTDYQFRIGKESPWYRFRTMPAKATDTVTFVSGGDVGVNEHAMANNEQAAKQNPSFALIGGDLAYENGKSVAAHLAFLRNYSRGLVGKDGRLIPMVACIGNHEVDGGYGAKREKAPFFYSLFDGLFTDTGYATLDFGDYLSLVLLDSGHTSEIGGEQAYWLSKVLKARQDHPHVFAVNHVPAYPSARAAEGTGGKLGTGEPNRANWVPLFERYRVPVVLEHHDHTFKRTRPLKGGSPDKDGVVYLGDGSWGRIRALQKPEKLTMMAEVSQDYHLSVHRLEGEERFHLALGEDGRVMDTCRTAQRSTGLVRRER